MSGRARCAPLAAVVEGLKEQGIRFVLVHESALMGWGIDVNAMLPVADVLLLDAASFQALGCEPRESLGEYAGCDVGGVSVRLWSRRSLGLEAPFDVTACPAYGCEALAPELVLVKLPYSPDAPLLLEQRARLAAIVHASELEDSELALVARYVRGE